MSAAITCRPMMAGEETAVCAMIERCFKTFVAPGYTPEGVREFLAYASPEPMAGRVRGGSFVLMAESGGVVAGMIEMRDHDHVSLLFVDAAFMRRGISRELLRWALGICRAARPDLQIVTVNSSPYAVPVYERLGFHALSPEQESNGIRYTPMALPL
jgi:GNAT superfamily N-acetyltransferase